jgi:hypothetical protein
MYFGLNERPRSSRHDTTEIACGRSDLSKFQILTVGSVLGSAADQVWSFMFKF